MQATFVLCDWLAYRLPPNHSPDPWTDFSQPAAEIESAQTANDVGLRQGLYAQYLRALLEQSSVREEFAAFLARSLAIDQDEATAVMWEPPRALITEAVPTLLRRLERGWRRAGTPDLEQHTARVPLPEFLPRTLFSDLQVPDVAIRLPALGRIVARAESMPIAQALREFAPGRVSRRFGVSHGRERHWIAPGNGTEVSIDSFCPPPDRQALGHFGLVDDNGNVRGVPVFRPHAIHVALAPLDVQQSSNSFLEWHAEIVPTASGHEIDLPEGSSWAQVLNSLSFHTHHLGLPIELRRFSVGATASVGRGRQNQVAYPLRFVSASEHGEETAGVGFDSDVDAIQVEFAFPERLYEVCARDDRLVRALRIARFRDYIRDSARLDGLANAFQRDWLSQAYLSAITAEALRTGVALEAAEGAVHDQTSRTTIREVLETILRWDESDSDDDDNDGSPRRLQELLDLLAQDRTKSVLHDAARVLWTSIDIEWETWLRARFKSTLGAALVDAAHGLCPRMNAGALAVDVRVHVVHEDFERSASSEGRDEIWLTETTIGGGGFVEELLARYVEDPRRYFRFLEAALSASDLETTGDELARVLSQVASSTLDNASLVSAFDAVRTANSHNEGLRALSALRAELARRGIQPTTTLLVSVNARLLGPGTNSDTDHYLAAAVDAWQASERNLGVDIDARVFALVRSSDPALEQALGVTPVGESDRARAAWRFGVLCGMLWPRGAQVRTESLRAWNPYDALPECDRLLVLAALPLSVRQVLISSDLWFEQLGQALLEDGRAQLVSFVDDGDQLSIALLRIAMEPVDSEAILVHARLTGVYRDGEQIRAEIELPEAMQ